MSNPFLMSARRGANHIYIRMNRDKSIPTLEIDSRAEKMQEANKHACMCWTLNHFITSWITDYKGMIACIYSNPYILSAVFLLIDPIYRLLSDQLEGEMFCKNCKISGVSHYLKGPLFLMHRQAKYKRICAFNGF